MSQDLKNVYGKIRKQNELLELDLTGKKVITEAATGAYFVTPFIAALAGAEVTAFVKDSKYGKALDVISFNEKIRRDLFNEYKINFTHDLTESILREADVITNSGHLRPIDRNFLNYVKEGCVIPLMYEAWEFRESDLDLEYCREMNILVGATNERHTCVEVFKYLGDMAVKLILDSGASLYKNRFVIICNNDFGPYIANVLCNVCESVGVIDCPERKNLYDDRIDHLSEFPSVRIPEKYKDAERIIFTAYPFDKNWIGGAGSEIKQEHLISEFRNPYILRFAGDLDTKQLEINNIQFYPEDVKSGHMGILPSDIGFDPVIKLQAGGLKAAQLMLEGKSDFKGELLVEIM